MTYREEVERRRTFAVIAHPDAGKTTLTEKLLLFGGAIHVAGAVKSNKIKKSAMSDFMEIERQRGISVSTSVMSFEYAGKKINILDTPGHEDFAEDTYRTLSATDSVIMVVDGAKGVEMRTRKLMEVCRMRNTPVMVFVNKLDREAKDPFDLLDEIERELRIKVVPLSWPLGSGSSFKGVYDRFERKLRLFVSADKQRLADDVTEIVDLTSDVARTLVGTPALDGLVEDLEILDAVYDGFDRGAYDDGRLAPVFFGSASNNFGVRELLDCFVEIAPHPRRSFADLREVDPFEKKLTGFIFKIHANLDPDHRNRIAFLKICSGVFERNRSYFHVASGSRMRFAAPNAFLADRKSVVDESFPGDIVGLYDSGGFRIGDTLTEGELLRFKGVPSFAPELFRYVENADPMKSKQLAKGIDHLTDEGVAQLFTMKCNGRKVIACVGMLQFDVIQYRLEHEYGAKCRYEPVNLYKACWFTGDDSVQLDDFAARKYNSIARDKHGRDVFLADSQYSLQMAQEKFNRINFHFTSEF
jgi:peptide chain release factor 3